MSGDIISKPGEELTTKLHYDNMDNNLIVEHSQDVEAILKNNRGLRNEGLGMFKSGNGRRVASIPLVIYHKLMKDGIANDPARFKRWLNDPDNQAFRTSTGKA